YIEVFDQKANKYNKYAIYLACLEIKGHPYALEKQFTNTKKYSEATIQKHQGKRFRIQQDNNKSIISAQLYHTSLSSYASSSLFANAQNSHIIAKSLNNGPLDNFALRHFTRNNLDKFNYLLLKATISNR
ncbi:23177_t:CDS:2, partial [Dentiscutata erythropus]